MKFSLKIINYDYLVLAAITFLANFPVFNPAFLPRHDSMAVFQIFYFFYNELFFHHQVAHWFPYGTCGLLGYFLQLSLTPVSYLVMLIGWLLKIKNALLLFKLAMLGEQLVMLSGMYLLCRVLFSARSTRFIVCSAAVLSTIWFNQVYFNFRIYYMSGWVCYFMVLFLKEKKPRFFWLTGITGIIWALGNSPYFICLWFFVFTIMASVFLLKDKKIFRALFLPGRLDFLLFLLFLASSCGYLYFLKSASGFTAITTPLRDSVAGRNSLLTFLIYGGKAKPDMLLQSLIFGSPTHLPLGMGIDNSVYIGLLPLVFFISAIMLARSMEFLLFLVPAVALIWLSFGGIFACLAYYFPGLAYYRHIGLDLSLAKIFIIIAGGFGLDNFWGMSLRKKTYHILALLLLFSFIIDIHPGILKQWLKPLFQDMATADLLKIIPQILRQWLSPFNGIAGENHLPGIDLSIFLRLGAYFFAIIAIITCFAFGKLFGRNTARAVKAALMISFLIDMFSFRSLVFRETPRLPKSYYPYLGSVIVNELKFQEKRLLKPQDARQEQALKLITRPGHLANYSYAYNFVQFDPCRTEFVTYLLSSEIDKKLKEANTGNTPGFAQQAGCDSPKLILADNLTFPHSEIKGTVRVKEFSSNKILIDSEHETAGGAWLIYLDAFHPGWQATVNGKKALVAKANSAFKAVRLEKGRNLVRLFFNDGLSTIISNSIAVLGVFTGLLFLGVSFKITFINRKNKQ